MILLIIETATERGIVSIVYDEKVLVCVDLPYGYQNSKFLLPKIDEAFQLAKLKPSDVDLVVSGIGPGSYTGIRVGAVAAKTVAFALRIPLVGVCSLEGFVAKQEGAYAVIVDAKIGGVYLQIGCNLKGKVIERASPKVLSIQEAISEISEVPVLVTPSIGLLKSKFEKLNPPRQWVWEELAPNPLAIARAGLAKFNAGQFALDGSLDLLYLRKTQAEIERGK